MKKFLSKVTGRANRLAVAGLVLLGGVLSTFAEGEPIGVLDSFSADTAGAAIKALIIVLLGVMGTVYGAKLGIVVLRWVYNTITGQLASRK